MTQTGSFSLSASVREGGLVDFAILFHAKILSPSRDSPNIARLFVTSVFPCTRSERRPRDVRGNLRRTLFQLEKGEPQVA